MKLQESGENYLENIYILKKQNGFVRSVDLARTLNFSKPSVSRAIHILEDNGYLKIVNSGILELTPAGQEIAEMLYERHVFLTNYLISLGVEAEIAAEDACRIEHVLSETTFAKMKEHITFCLQECKQSNDEQFLRSNRETLCRYSPDSACPQRGDS